MSVIETSRFPLKKQSHHELSGSLHHTHIEPQRSWYKIDFAELWRYRDLLYLLVWRDVKVRYKQTLLGAMWAVLQPVMMMVVFTVVFGRMAKVPVGDIPYPIFVYAGLLPWTFFSTAISSAAQSVIRSEKLITKIYFPRLIIPVSSLGAGLIDLMISFTVLFGLMFYYQMMPGWSALWILCLIPLLILSSLGIGLLMAGMNVSYRDFRYVVPFFIQIWLFATPTVYMNIDQIGNEPKQAVVSTARENAEETAESRESASTEIAGGRLAQIAIEYNPMTGLVGFFRACLLNQPLPWERLRTSVVMMSIVFLVGLVYFRYVETRFADII